MKGFILISLLFSVGLLHAQVPGYLGKRWIAYYELNTTPLTEHFFSSQLPILTFKHGIGANYVISKSTQIGVFGRFQNSTITVPTNAYLLSDNNSLDFYFKQRELGVTIKHYNFHIRGDIAPVGRYVSGQIGYTQMGIEDNGTFLPSGRKDIITYHTAFASLGYGISTILNDIIVIDYGAQIGATFTPLFLERWDNSITWSDPFYSSTREKWMGNYLLNVYLKIGIIPK